jgi:phosphatidylglycerophosphatase A
VLFRAFDILKPGPVGVADRRVGGGIGIMLDDAVAGIFAALLLGVARWLL